MTSLTMRFRVKQFAALIVEHYDSSHFIEGRGFLVSCNCGWEMDGYVDLPSQADAAHAEHVATVLVGTSGSDQ